MTNTDVVPPDQDEERTGASKRIIASAVVVAAIVALGIVLSVTNLLGGKTETPAPATAPSPSITASGSATTSSAASEPSVCGLTDVKMSGAVASAPDATWTLVGTTAAPAINDQGPGKIEEDGYRSCYARTPTGALLAAANYSALGSYGPVRNKFYEQATVPGPGRDALLKKPILGAGAGGTRVQIAGFRVLKYDGKTADIDVALRTSNGALAAMVFNLEWSDGDWKLRLADDGTELSPVSQIPSLNGYILWAGA
jgi:hypothetical protein